MAQKTISKQKFLLFLADIIIIFSSLYLSYLIRLNISVNFLELGRESASCLLILFIYLISFYIFDLYNVNTKHSIGILFFSVFCSLAFVSLIVTLLFYLFPFFVGRGIFFISLFFIGILIFIWRLFFYSIIRDTLSVRRLLIIGAGQIGHEIFSIVKNHPEYKVVGFIDDRLKNGSLGDIMILGDSYSIEKVVADYKVNNIVITIEPEAYSPLSKSLIDCRIRGINVYHVATFYEYLLNKLPVHQLDEKWLFYCDGFDKLRSKIYKRFKKTLDLIIALILFVFTLPVMILASLLIKLTSKGPLLYIQERSGENMVQFKMLKFRTMMEDAEFSDPKWADENDSRVTKIGRILRKARLDELPQLINVIKGEMSLIGPRPEREFFVNKLMQINPYYSLRFAVKPGLTGWAQVNYGYGSSEEDATEKLRYDLYYIKNQSLLLDLRIILKTFRVVLFGLGR